MVNSDNDEDDEDDEPIHFSCQLPCWVKKQIKVKFQHLWLAKVEFSSAWKTLNMHIFKKMFQYIPERNSQLWFAFSFEILIMYLWYIDGISAIGSYSIIFSNYLTIRASPISRWETGLTARSSTSKSYLRVTEGAQSMLFYLSLLFVVHHPI